MTLDLDRPDGTQAHDVYVARQPIFDDGNRRVAYELLYRASARATSAGDATLDAMCSDTALHSVVSIGLDRLTGGATAFINVTREHLLAELHRVFDPRTIVLELLETIDADDEVVRACARAAADGYVLALDDYDGRPELDALLPHVRIVKIDVLHRSEAELQPLIGRLRARGLQVLAERVETGAQRALCARLGCTLFQGYVFSRPETLAGRAMSVEQTAILHLLGLLSDPAVGEAMIDDAFCSQPALSHALLRIVNSAAIGARSVASIPHAVRIVGRGALSRWLLLMLVTSTADDSPVAHEAVMQALVRARFCELLATIDGSHDGGSRFLVGLLSCLDVLLGMPLDRVLQRLPVTNEVRDALLHGVGPHASALATAQAFEHADWQRVDGYANSLVTPGGAVSEAWLEATQWAMDRVTAEVA